MNRIFLSRLYRYVILETSLLLSGIWTPAAKHDLIDLTFDILSLVLTDTAACYSAVGLHSPLHSPRELVVFSKDQSLDALRLASSKKSINVVQFTAKTKQKRKNSKKEKKANTAKTIGLDDVGGIR